jgi:hypothetical protein
MRMVPRMPPIYMWFSCNASEPHWSMRRIIRSARYRTQCRGEPQGWHPQQSPVGGQLIPCHALGAGSALPPSFCRRCESRRALLVRRGGRKSIRLSAVPRFGLVDFVSRVLLSVDGSRASAGFRAPPLPSESARRSQVRAVLLPTLQRLPPAGLGSRWLRAQSAVTGDVGGSEQSRCAAAAAQGAEQ